MFSNIFLDSMNLMLQAFLDAWDEACASDGTATVVIPGGTFLTGPVTFKGPCKAKMVFQTAGTVIAPEDLNAFPSQNWIVFMYLKGLKMTGGKFDGRGASSWSKNKCSKSKFCKVLPTVSAANITLLLQLRAFTIFFFFGILMLMVDQQLTSRFDVCVCVMFSPFNTAPWMTPPLKALHH